MKRIPTRAGPGLLVIVTMCVLLITPVAGLERLEPPGGCYLGFILSSEEDISRLSSRLGITPAVCVRFFDFPLSASDRENLNRFLDQITQVEGIAMLTLQPSRGLEAVAESDCRDLADICSAFEGQGIGGIFIRFGHEMNGNWYAWGQQPLLFKSKFRLLAGSVRSRTARTAMVWAPNYGVGYPFGMVRPAPGSPDFLALDTDHDGIISDRDDMYEPYYPGDDAVDWVGMTLYHWGVDYPWFENELPPANSFAQSLIGAYQGSIPNFYERYCADAIRKKPIAIAETAAFYNTQVTGPGEFEIKRAWWRQVFNISGDSPDGWDVANHFPKLKCIDWFDEYKQESVAQNNWIDWRVSADSRIRAAFISDVRKPRNGRPYFLSAQEADCFHSLDCITENDLPAILPLRGQLSVSLNIKAEMDCDLVVDLLDENFGWQGGTRVPITAPGQNVSTSFKINQALTDGKGYRWSIFLTPRGGDYLSAITWYKGSNPVAREIKPDIRILAYPPVLVPGANAVVRFKYESAETGQVRIDLLDHEFNRVTGETISVQRGDGVAEVSLPLAATVPPGVFWLEGSVFGFEQGATNMLVHSDRLPIAIEKILQADSLMAIPEPRLVSVGEVIRFVVGYAASAPRQLRVSLCDTQSNALAVAALKILPGRGIRDITISYPNAVPARYLMRASLSEGELDSSSAMVWSANQNIEIVSAEYLNWIESVWRSVLEADPVLPSDDPDHDGAVNEDEFLAGTDPRDPLDVLAIEIQKNGPVPVVAWPSKVGRCYRLYGTTDLKIWTPASGLIFGTGEMTRFSPSSITGNTATFYQVQVANQ